MSQDRYTYLIYQELNSTLSASECKELKEWLNASPTNMLHKEEILAALVVLDDTEPAFEVDVEADYAAVRTRLGLEGDVGNSKSPKSGSKALWWWIIGALLLSLALVGYYHTTSQSDTPVIRAMIATEGVKEVQLVDGSTVRLNVGSSLKYPEAFDGDTRAVELIGEGYFDIARDEAKPFVITTAQSKVEVLGTSFTVREDNDMTTVSVLTGTVRMSSITNDKSVVLVKDQKGTIDENNNISSEDNENLNALAWDTGKLRFKSTPLTQVFGDIASFYNISILNKSGMVGQCNYSMTTQSISLDDMLTNLQTLYHFEIERKGKNVVIVSGGDCN